MHSLPLSSLAGDLVDNNVTMASIMDYQITIIAVHEYRYTVYLYL